MLHTMTLYTTLLCKTNIIIYFLMFSVALFAAPSFEFIL